MSETHARLVKQLEETTLPECELKKILFYMRLLVLARRGEKISPPPPEQWQQLPFWLQWKIYIVAMFCAQVHDLST